MKNFLKYLRTAEEYVLGLGLMATAIFVCVQVVLRYIFKSALPWAEELDRYIAILLTFMGASLGIEYNTHFNVEAVIQFIPKWFRKYLDSFVFILCGIFFALICYLTFLNIQKLSRFGSLTPTLRIPMYVPYIPILICCFVASFRYFRKALFTILALNDKSSSLNK
jgi:C4-dicarboxylate transporter DctQ subunit